MTTLGLWPDECAEHDADLLLRLRAWGGPADLLTVFDQDWAPRWAAEAAARLLAAGKLTRDEAGVLTITGLPLRKAVAA